MDLEARLAEVVTAVHEGRAADVLAERFTFDVDGRRGTRDEALAWVGAQSLDGSKVRVVSVKRNLLFLDWGWPKVGAGMAIIAFDQDGRVASVTARRR
jgi:hypothetical protein